MIAVVHQMNHTKGEKLMTDSKKLKDKIKESGKKKGYLAAVLGVSRATFCKLINNKAEFKASQIDALCKELGITTLVERKDIFFAPSGSLNEPSEE